MSETTPDAPATARTGAHSLPDGVPPHHGKAARTGWAGWVLFAGIMMVLIGSFQAIAGFVALFRDTYYLVTSAGLLVTADYTTWGWVHLVLGLVVVAAGVATMRGSMWGRVIGVVLAGLSALANLAFLAAYPLWSLTIIALDVLVIYSLVVHGSERSSAG